VKVSQFGTGLVGIGWVIAFLGL